MLFAFCAAIWLDTVRCAELLSIKSALSAAGSLCPFPPSRLKQVERVGLNLFLFQAFNLKQSDPLSPPLCKCQAMVLKDRPPLPGWLGIPSPFKRPVKESNGAAVFLVGCVCPLTSDDYGDKDESRY